MYHPADNLKDNNFFSWPTLRIGGDLFVELQGRYKGGEIVSLGQCSSFTVINWFVVGEYHHSVLLLIKEIKSI